MAVEEPGIVPGITVVIKMAIVTVVEETAAAVEEEEVTE